jgi:hypothetical protein
MWFLAEVTVTCLGRMLQVVMMPPSARLAELRPCLVGAHLGPGSASWHGFGTPPRGPAGQRQPRCLA